MLPASFPSPGEGVIHLGPLPLRAYALCIVLGAVAATAVASRRWVHRGGRPGFVADLAVVAMPAAIVGARIYHLITSPQAYFGAGGHPLQAFAIWKGGLGVPGGVVAGLLAGIWFCRRHGVDWRLLAGPVAAAIPIGQVLGRFGNYFNQELYGGPSTLPWAVRIDPVHRPVSSPGIATYQPTFAYEALWSLLVVFTVVTWAERRFHLRGPQCFALYAVLYALGRGWVEALRIDPANHILGLRVNDWVSLLVVLGAGGYLLRSLRRDRALGVHRPDPTLPGTVPPAEPVPEREEVHA